jgi:hypothetical protein
MSIEHQDFESTAQEDVMSDHGLVRVRKSCAEAARWFWCEEHQRARYGGSNPCMDLHEDYGVQFDEWDGTAGEEFPYGG